MQKKEIKTEAEKLYAQNCKTLKLTRFENKLNIYFAKMAMQELWQKAGLTFHNKQIIEEEKSYKYYLVDPVKNKKSIVLQVPFDFGLEWYTKISRMTSAEVGKIIESIKKELMKNTKEE